MKRVSFACIAVLLLVSVLLMGCTPGSVLNWIGTLGGTVTDGNAAYATAGNLVCVTDVNAMMAIFASGGNAFVSGGNAALTSAGNALVSAGNAKPVSASPVPSDGSVAKQLPTPTPAQN